MIKRVFTPNFHFEDMKKVSGQQNLENKNKFYEQLYSGYFSLRITYLLQIVIVSYMFFYINSYQISGLQKYS